MKTRTWIGMAWALLAMMGMQRVSSAEHQVVTLRSLIAETVSVESLARWPAPAYTCLEASSHDPSKLPGTSGWFANNDYSQYVRVETQDGHTRNVLMDVDGPGVISRFWLTTNATKSGKLCIYLDGAKDPTIDFPAFDLMSGGLDVASPWVTAHPGYDPHANGGNTLYLPIPFAKHCLVTWEEAAVIANVGRYYQINYRCYAKGTQVETWSTAAMAQAKDDLTAAGHLLLEPPATSAGRESTLDRTVPAGGIVTLDLPPGPAALARFEMQLTSADGADREQLLRSTVLRMHCDDEDTIWCPISDFFGSGVGVNRLRSWYRRVDHDGVMSCRWTMPYRAHAQLIISNLGDHPVQVRARAFTNPWAWDDRSMHFRCTWRQQVDILSPPFRDWNYLDATGQGVYVGDSLVIFNPVQTWYGEGDEKIFVDHAPLPVQIGTGTEDYYNYSYAPKPAFQTPFANLVRIDQPMTQGYNVCTRTRHLDAIPFTSAFHFDMEIMPWQETRLTYAVATYWYAFPGATCALAPMREEAMRPLQHLPAVRAFPGAIEGEALTVLSTTGAVTLTHQRMEQWGIERWSGAEQLLIRASKIGDAVELVIPVSEDRPYGVVVHATQAPDYASLRLSINGEGPGVVFDGYATSVSPSGPINLGIHRPDAGRLILRLELVGANAQAVAPATLAGLDCVVLHAEAH